MSANATDPDILLDVEDWHEHEQQRLERSRLKAALPYARLLVAGIMRHAEVVCWPGNFVSEDGNPRRYGSEHTLQIKRESWEQLYCDGSRKAWNGARHLGMLLPTYDRFLAEVHRRVRAHRHWPKPDAKRAAR